MTNDQMERAVRVCLRWVANDDLGALKNAVLKAKVILKEIEEAPLTIRPCADDEPIEKQLTSAEKERVWWRDVARKAREGGNKAIARAEKAEGERDTWYANHSTVRQRLYESVARAEKAEEQLAKAVDKIHRMDDEFNQAFARTEKAEWERDAAQLARIKAIARAEKAEEHLKIVQDAVRRMPLG